jgi:hypothetical protein
MVLSKKETLLSQPSLELQIIDATNTPARDKARKWKKPKQDKVLVKSIDNDEDIKVIPSVLLTYNAKFTKISTFDDENWEPIDFTS